MVSFVQVYTFLVVQKNSKIEQIFTILHVMGVGGLLSIQSLISQKIP